MKILSVQHNNRRRAFEIGTRRGVYTFPYACLERSLPREETVRESWVDRELGREGLSYRTESGTEGAEHVDAVLEFNEDPEHLTDLLLHQLTIEARRYQESGLSTRELVRRLGTSPSQLYRLLDPANSRKSIRQMLILLHAFGCEVELTVKKRSA